MSLKLAREVREGLSSLATIKKRPAHALAREAVEAYVKAELAREQFTQDADKAWQHYQETGLHASSEVSWRGLTRGARRTNCPSQNATCKFL